MDKLGKGCVVYADEVETMQFDWGKIRLLSEPGLTGAEMMTFGRVELSPGAGHDRHNHPDTEEIIYVVSGEGEQMVEGLWASVNRTPSLAIRSSRGVS